jgi:hypothetical protein
MDLTDVRWQKASCSCSNGGNCVEVTATQDTSVAPHKSGEDMLYLMRDSKDPDGPQLAFTTTEWEAFIAGVKDGEFDLNDHVPGSTTAPLRYQEGRRIQKRSTPEGSLHESSTSKAQFAQRTAAPYP